MAAIAGENIGRAIPRVLRDPRMAAVWFASEAIFLTFFWTWLSLAPGFRPVALTGGAGDPSLFAFAGADSTIIGTSLIAAAAAVRGRGWAWLPMLIATATSCYPAMYSLFLALAGGGGELWAVLGMSLTLGNLVFAVSSLPRHHRLIGRLADQAPTGWNLMKTAGELLMLWTVFLWLIPALINRIDDRSGWGSVVAEVSNLAGLGVLSFGTILLVWSVMVMAWYGHGTPFPFDAPRRLVLQGPYRFVRNPQVIGGLCQGLSLLLFEWSPLIALYLISGIAIWQLVLRPWEEAALLIRFGEAYADYRRRVPCWIPMLVPNSPPMRVRT